MVEPKPIEVALLVADAIEQLGRRYLIGGSLASALYGEVRTTRDADLVAELRLEDAKPLAQALAGAFYVEREAIEKAVRRRGSFNAIHLATLFKVDVFVSEQRPFEQSRFGRRVYGVVALSPERKAWVTSSEDLVLAKLEWYRIGGEISERQWRDVLGVVRTQAERLDIGYIRKWAVDLGVDDLLELALKESQ